MRQVLVYDCARVCCFVAPSALIFLRIVEGLSLAVADRWEAIVAAYSALAAGYRPSSCLER